MVSTNNPYCSVILAFAHQSPYWGDYMNWLMGRHRVIPHSKDRLIDVDYISIRHACVGSISNWRRSDGLCYLGSYFSSSDTKRLIWDFFWVGVEVDVCVCVDMRLVLLRLICDWYFFIMYSSLRFNSFISAESLINWPTQLERSQSV